MADVRQILLSQADPGGQPRRWFAAVLVGAALWMGAMPLPQLRAAELRESEVPQPLRSWVPWVLQDHETIACPAAYNDGDRHECVWPARLTLAVGAQGGRFSLDVEIFRSDELVVLPGQPEAWPRGVRANGRAVPMTESGGRPARATRRQAAWLARCGRPALAARSGRHRCGSRHAFRPGVPPHRR